MIVKQDVYSILPKEMPTRAILASIPVEKLVGIKAVEGEVELYAKFSNKNSRTFKHAKANQTLWSMLTKYRHTIVEVAGYSIKFTIGSKRQIRVAFILPSTKKQQLVQFSRLGSLDNSNSMGYLTREEAELLALFDTEDSAIPEVLIDFSVLWRFPWPDEDVNINYLMDLDPFYKELCNEIPKRINSRRLSFTAKLELAHHNCSSTEFCIIGERHSPEGRRTIINCNRCQKPWNLSPLNLELAKRAILSLSNTDPLFLLQVAARLKANPALF
jgi:hypothetical protein